MQVQAPVGDEQYKLDSSMHSIGFLTRVLQVQISDYLRANGGLGMGPAALTLLRLVDANPGIRQAHAARIMLIQESNMATLVKELLAKGYIERTARPVAGRRGLAVSDSGRKRLEETAASTTLDRSFASALKDKEYAQLVKLMSRLYISRL